MTKKITVTSRLGKPSISTSGFGGDSCIAATESLERVLSGEGGVEIREHQPDRGVEQENGFETN
jgi:hypothetical protein